MIAIMIPRKCAFIGALLCVLGCDLFAQSEHTFDLDVPEGHTSSWAIDNLGGANRLEADLEIRELRRDVRWRPRFNLMLRAADWDIVLSMIQRSDDRHVTVSVILMRRGRIAGQQSLDGWRLQKGGRFQLSMDWSTPGVLAIASMGTDRGRFELDFVPTSLRVSASTGQLVGHTIRLTTK
jgi:hypothetical protein